MNQEEKRKQTRKRNKERYSSDKKYREYQLNKTKIYRRALAILAKRHRKEFDKIREAERKKRREKHGN